jgi:hypothetical protein
MPGSIVVGGAVVAGRLVVGRGTLIVGRGVLTVGRGTLIVGRGMLMVGRGPEPGGRGMVKVGRGTVWPGPGLSPGPGWPPPGRPWPGWPWPPPGGRPRMQLVISAALATATGTTIARRARREGVLMSVLPRRQHFRCVAADPGA